MSAYLYRLVSHDGEVYHVRRELVIANVNGERDVACVEVDIESPFHYYSGGTGERVTRCFVKKAAIGVAIEDGKARIDDWRRRRTQSPRRE